MSDKKASIGGKILSKIFSLFGLLPFWILYGFADVVAFIAGLLIGYRKRVIRDNLNRCFPELSKAEKRKIEKRFYHFLGDYFVETLKLGVMSRNEIIKRMTFDNFEELNEILKSGKSITLYLGHYCNWEWVSSMPLHMIKRSVGGQIYHPLENEAADYAFLRIRNHFGAVSIDKSNVLAPLVQWRREGIPSIMGYISDQGPDYYAIHYIADFFGQETPSFTGPERLGKMFGTAAYYLDMQRPKRGYYRGRFIKMSDDMSKEAPFSMTQRYYDLLEENIRRAPQYWLWSHKRWKREFEGMVEFFGEEEARRRLLRP